MENDDDIDYSFVPKPQVYEPEIIQVDDPDEIMAPLYKHDKNKNSTGEIILCRSGMFIYSKDLDIIRRLRGWFTIRYKLRRNKKFFITLTSFKYYPNDHCIAVPRFGMLTRLTNVTQTKNLMMFNPIIDNQITSKCHLHYSIDDDFVQWDAELSNNQKVVMNWLIENVYTKSKIKHGSAGCIVKMATGTGKTYEGAALIHELKVPTLVICHDSGDSNQWIKTLSTIFPEIRIGQYNGREKTDGDIIVGIINSMSASVFKYTIYSGHPKYPQRTIEETSQKFFSRFGLIIYDECHLYSAKERAKIFRKAQAPCMMGISATPDENPNKDPIIYWNLGPVIDAQKIPGYENDEVTYKCKTTIVEYSGSPEYTKQIKNASTDETSTTLMIKQFSQDPHRLAVVRKYIKWLYKKGRNIVVFADRKEYLETISKSLSIKSKIMVDDESYESVKTIVGGAKDKDMREATLASRIILTTYSYFGVGKSIKRLDALIFATPRRTGINQFIGRIFRRGSDNTIRRYIVDIVDANTSLKSQASARKKVYEQQENVGRTFTITKIKEKWEDYHREEPKLAMTNADLQKIIQSLK
jgi:superfamily II DNA or RNA helicase